MPGKPVKGGTYTKLVGSDDAGSFAILLPKKLALGPGLYWVSVVPNLDFDTGGEWGWEGNTTINGDSAMWENPGNGFGTGCTSWESYDVCFGYGQDEMFELKGTSKRE